MRKAPRNASNRKNKCNNRAKIPKITIIAKITKITNQESDTGKHNKSLKKSSENNKSSERHSQNINITHNCRKNNENNKSRQRHWQIQQITEREQGKGLHKCTENTKVSEQGKPIHCSDRISFEVGRVLLNLLVTFYVMQVLEHAGRWITA